MQYRAALNIAVYGSDHHREFVLARLQKAQCFGEPRIIRGNLPQL